MFFTSGPLPAHVTTVLNLSQSSPGAYACPGVNSARSGSLSNAPGNVGGSPGTVYSTIIQLPVNTGGGPQAPVNYPIPPLSYVSAYPAQYVLGTNPTAPSPPQQGVNSNQINPASGSVIPSAIVNQLYSQHLSMATNVGRI
jgi:hypothetical protein